MELFQAVPSSSILLSASPYEKLQWKVEEVVVDFDAVRVLMPLPAPFGAIWITLHFGPWRSSFECEPVTCSSCARRPAAAPVAPDGVRGRPYGWPAPKPTVDGPLLCEKASQPGCHRSEERRVGKECRSRWSPY